MVQLGNDWDELLGDEFQKDYYQQLRRKLLQEYKTREIYPDMYHLFEALRRTSFQNTKVVILGQDPYHGPGQAHGLAFSVQKGVAKPPSLVNIFEEIRREFGFEAPDHGDLSYWADQGVLLLNTSLSVRRGEAGSHSHLGWQLLTGRMIEILGASSTPRVFFLWGNHARSKKNMIDEKIHLVLEGPHPSPLSAYRGFFGCNHFLKANEFLEKTGRNAIDWQIPQGGQDE